MARKIGNIADCVCNVAGEFPILGNLGIISATLRTNINVSVTEDGLVLSGPTFGDLAITAYAPLIGESLSCAGKAGASFQWEQRMDCDTTGYLIMRFIPKGNAKAFMQGSVTTRISMESIAEYENFSASAAGGPHTPYFMDEHYDGYNLTYTGNPIQISIDDQYKSKELSIFTGIFPAGVKLYLTNFSWEYTPPNIPNVSYSFLVSYDGV